MLISLLRGMQVSENNLVLADYRMASSNSLVLLVSYASAGAEEDPGAMIVDQFSFGPRRVYVILHLVAHGDSWGVNGVTVVPYISVSISYEPYSVQGTFSFTNLMAHVDFGL